MRHGVAGRKLGRPTGHRQLMYRNLVTDLLRYEKVVTTEPKAKTIRPMAEKMITLAKDGSLHARRQANSLAWRQRRQDLGDRFGSGTVEFQSPRRDCLGRLLTRRIPAGVHRRKGSLRVERHGGTVGILRTGILKGS